MPIDKEKLHILCVATRQIRRHILMFVQPDYIQTFFA